MLRIELRRPWCCRWAGALLVALAFVGHDALMVTDAHAAQMTIGHHAAHGGPHADEAVTAHHDAAASAHSPVPTDELDGCDVARSIVRPAAPDTHPTALAVAIAASGLAVVSLQPTVPVMWSEPTAPPGVRRALLQVFLN